MTELPKVVELSPEEEAVRLWKGALEARGKAGESLVALCEMLDLGARALEILAVHRLQEVKADFPATIGAQLELPEPEVDVHRDAVEIPSTLSFTDVIDLLSEESLDCVAPRLHRGWEDRRFSCRRSRKTAREALGSTLGRDEREDFLTLAAYRNRLFRSPPPVRLSTTAVLDAFAALEKWVDGLLGG